MIEQVLFTTFVLQSIVGTRPYARDVVDLALAIACAPAWAVALIFGTLRFWAQERDVRQRAITAVFTAKNR